MPTGIATFRDGALTSSMSDKRCDTNNAGGQSGTRFPEIPRCLLRPLMPVSYAAHALEVFSYPRRRQGRLFSTFRWTSPFQTVGLRPAPASRRSGRGRSPRPEMAELVALGVANSSAGDVDPAHRQVLVTKNPRRLSVRPAKRTSP